MDEENSVDTNNSPDIAENDYLDWALGNSFEHGELSKITLARINKLRENGTLHRLKDRPDLSISVFKEIVELNVCIRIAKWLIFALMAGAIWRAFF